MHLHWSRRLRHRMVLAVSIALLGTTGVLASTASGPFAASAACGCAPPQMVCHLLRTPETGLYTDGSNTEICKGDDPNHKGNYELEEV